MIEGYQKIRTIGKGSFGTATLYNRVKDQKQVVLKEITTSDMDYEERATAYTEIEILSALHHPNIISYFDSIANQDSVIIVMDYADGGNLSQLLSVKKSKNESFKEKGIMFIVFQISNALAYIHGKKILHRDLKPANIFLTSNGGVRIGDFGISKMLYAKSQAQTVVGTPYYLSPEMCEGHEYNEKSDIWALGCMIYEMATLKKPFNAPNLPLLVQKIIKCEYEAIPNNNYYCKDLKILVELILQKKVAFRPTANFIYEVIVPNIMVKNDITFDSYGINTPDISSTAERSVLYEITNNEADGIDVRPTHLPHKKILEFSISSTHSIAILEDHAVYAWGSNKYCELGAKNSDSVVANPVHVKSLEQLNIIKCAAGQNFSLFLSETGHVYSCGRGNSGCLGHGNLGNVYFPILLKYLSKIAIKDVCCGSRHAVALDKEGRIYLWGSSTHGQLGLDNAGKILTTPKFLPLPEQIEKAYCSNDSTVLLGKTSLFVSGNNSCEKLLGVKNKHQENIVHNFRRVNKSFREVVDISVSDSHSVMVNSEGHAVLMGDNSYGQLGKHNGFLRHNRNVLKLQNKILQSTCNSSFSAMLDEKNVIWMCGSFKNTKQKENSDVDLTNKIQGVKSVLALYSSKENLSSGIFIKMKSIKSTDNALFVLVDTTCPPAFKTFGETYKPSTLTNISWAETKTY